MSIVPTSASTLSREESYSDFTYNNQDIYYEIRDYLREVDRTDEDAITAYLRATYGEEWAMWAEDLIADADEIIEYETAHGLPTGA